MDSYQHGSHDANVVRDLFPIYPDNEYSGPHESTLDEEWDEERDRASRHPARRDDWFDPLIEIVGDAAALTHLDTEPLPDEPFDWLAVEESDRAFVGRVLALSDRYCDTMLDTEYRTIARRILARVAARDPRVLRRSTNAPRLAAGLVWLAGRANGEFGRRGMRTSQRLWRWFEVNDCSDRGRSLRGAAGLDTERTPSSPWPRSEEVSLGDPALLHSSFRGGLIARRDALAGLIMRPRQWTPLGDGRSLRVEAEPTGVVGVGKGVVDGDGRVAVTLALGDDIDDARFFALSIPDALKLEHRLRQALATPITSAGRDEPARAR